VWNLFCWKLGLGCTGNHTMMPFNRFLQLFVLGFLRLLSIHSLIHSFYTRIQSTPWQDDARQELLSLGQPRQLYLGRAGALVVMLVLMFSVAACGPFRSSESEGQTTAAHVVEIAEQYVQDGDLGRARVQLQSVKVANPTHYLILLAETAVTERQDPARTGALVQLVIGLGLQSHLVKEYALANNMLPTAVPTRTPVALAQEQPTAVVQAAATATSVVESAPAAAIPEAGEEGSSTPAEAVEPAVVEATPTEAVVLAPTQTPVSNPRVQASNDLNVRGGPGTEYAVVDSIANGGQADIIAKNPQGDWWQVTLPSGVQGWVYGPLVTATGDTSTVTLAANIPAPPPTATAAPVVEQPPAALPPVADQPAAEQPSAEQPAAEEPAPPAPVAPPADGPDFVVTEKRLWDVYENGGRMSGPVVICGEKHELIVTVLDANGNRLNGVLVRSEFDHNEAHVTGAQGKGDGVVEMVLWSGHDVRVLRDTDGREVESEVARGMTTRTPEIPHEYLLAGGYCTDEASCALFATPPDQPPGCWGHFSWSVTFKRKY
jgi:uncharacterized protein YraI